MKTRIQSEKDVCIKKILIFYIGLGTSMVQIGEEMEAKNKNWIDFVRPNHFSVQMTNAH